MTNHKNPNHLINEKSPYLLQHAYNPVNWYPWGKEAFKKAKAEDKPIFLSIGYSTCHWCHVMERESFEDTEVGEVLNRDFVAIKVDREERPDIDSVYMSVCQAFTGSGGWPMTIVMTPDQNPFFAATYLPKTSRYGTMGLMELMQSIISMWDESRETLIKTGIEVSDYLKKQSKSPLSFKEPTKELLSTAVKHFNKIFDKSNGGFGGAPKFPTPHNLLFLLRYYALENDETALEMVEKTLLQMYRGGIFDHIGGGFSRYSTDSKWLAPHFEKMLYDNALLAYTYMEAFEMTKKPLYETIARRTIEYVLTELTDNKGGFYCGQDADSEGVEGKFYTFTPHEVIGVLGQEDGQAFCTQFDVTDSGNFEGKNIPNLLNNDNFDSVYENTKNQLKKLYDYRINRTKLHKDDKVLTSWNSLMILALSKAYRVTGDEDYLEAAQRAHRFIKRKLHDVNGRLLVRWRDEDAAIDGKIDDYSFYSLALLELYSSTLDTVYLKEAVGVAEQMVKLFFDEINGGFYMYAYDSEQLINRPKEIYDGAIPSGNSVAAYVVTQITKLTGEIKWKNISDKQLEFLAGNIRDYPIGYSFSLIAMTQVLYPSRELICVTNDEDAPRDFANFMKENNFINLTTIVKTHENEKILHKISPFTANYKIPENGPTYYLCENGKCLSPVYKVDELKDLLNDKQV